MAGLVAYTSSDEEDGVIDDVTSEVKDEATKKPASEKPLRKAEEVPIAAREPISTNTNAGPIAATQEQSQQSLQPATHKAFQAAPIGPSPLPANHESAASYAYPELETEDSNGLERPLSPYTTTRNLLRDLTLPQVPNLDIPPSPPGSPSNICLGRLEKYLEGKRSRNEHMNEILASAPAAANPSLPDLGMDHIGLHEWYRQYETGLPKSLIGWDMASFPPTVFRRYLRATLDAMKKEREEEQQRAGPRQAIEFVPAANTTTKFPTTAAPFPPVSAPMPTYPPSRR